MTIVDTIQVIADWLNEGVCTQYKFKKPPAEQREKIADSYNYEEVNPIAFPLFVPTKERMAPNVHYNMPSVCVQLVNGSDSLTENQRSISINLGISTWNPGIHAKDIYYPKAMVPDEPQAYKSGTDGWMDAWNFVDGVIHKLESISSIKNKIAIDNSTPITFGMYKEQDQVVDYYPMWFAYVQFSVKSDFLRDNADYEEYL